MDRQARTGDTVLVKNREMRVKSNIAVVAGGDGVKTTENNIIITSFHQPT